MSVDRSFPIDPPRFDARLFGHEVTEHIRGLIASGALRAGDRLRVEHLAAELQISVTPVREALVELSGEGFVERRPRRGYVVAELTRQGLEDRVLVLAMIAGELTARAAARVDPDEIAELRKLQTQLTDFDASGLRADAEAVNHRLHSRINLVAQSPDLAWIAQRSSRFVPRGVRTEGSDWPRTCTYEHAKVLAAMEKRDAEAARDAMFTHLVESGRELAIWFDDRLWAAPTVRADAAAPTSGAHPVRPVRKARAARRRA